MANTSRQPAPRHLRTAMVGRFSLMKALTLTATPMPPTMRATSPVRPRYMVSCVQKRRSPGWACAYVMSRTAGSRRRRAAGMGGEPAIERIARFHRLQLDELGAGAHITQALCHRHQLSYSRDGDALLAEARHLRRPLGRERLRAPNLDVGAEQGFRRARHRPREAVGEAPHADDRGHADADASQEVDEVPARAARLSPGHPRHEAHGQPATSLTTRPSLRVTIRSA